MVFRNKKKNFFKKNYNSKIIYNLIPIKWKYSKNITNCNLIKEIQSNNQLQF